MKNKSIVVFCDHLVVRCTKRERTLRAVLYDIYVMPEIKKDRLNKINQLRQEAQNDATHTVKKI
jgi:hypothetical protein